MLTHFGFLDSTLNLENKKEHGSCINRATFMPSSRRCLGSISKIEEHQENLTRIPTNLNIMLRRHVLNTQYFDLNKIHWNILQFLRLVGVLLWVSLRTRPDISWAVARITRLASSDESRARVCVKHVAQYLKWTLHFALFYEPATDRKWHCYTDASWSPEGDYSHQAVAIYYDTNLVAWQSQRQSLVALSSAEAELIASVWGNRLALSL